MARGGRGGGAKAVSEATRASRQQIAACVDPALLREDERRARDVQRGSAGRRTDGLRGSRQGRANEGQSGGQDGVTHDKLRRVEDTEVSEAAQDSDDEDDDDDDDDDDGDNDDRGDDEGEEYDRRAEEILQSIELPVRNQPGAGTSSRARAAAVDAQMGLEVDLRDDLRGAAGFSRKRKRKGSRRTVVFSAELERLLGEANEHYIDENYEQALTALVQVIQAEPRAATAWKTMSLIFEERGDFKNALKMGMMATEILPKAEQEWENLAMQCYKHGLLNDAVLCYEGALKNDRENFDLWYDYAKVNKELGNLKMAIRGFQQIQKSHPDSMHVVRVLAECAQEYGEPEVAFNAYHEALQWFRTNHPSGPPSQEEDDFRWSDLERLALCSVSLGRLKETVTIVRVGARWLQGRQDSWLDSSDIKDEFVFGSRSRGRQLTPLLHAALGKVALSAGQKADAAGHFERAVDCQKGSQEWYDVYDLISGAYYLHKMPKAALKYLGIMHTEDLENQSRRNAARQGDEQRTSMGLEQCKRMVNCLDATGESEQAQVLLSAVIESTEDERQRNELKFRLAEIYEKLGRTREALELIADVREAEVQRRLLPPEAESQADGLALGNTRTARKGKITTKKTPSLSPEERAAREEALTQEVRELSLKMSILKPQVDAGDADATDEWLEAAAVLISQFVNTRRFFPYDRYRPLRASKKIAQGADSNLADEATAMQSRLEAIELEDGNAEDYAADRGYSAKDSIPGQGVLRNKTWTEWRDIIISYGSVATLAGQTQKAIQAIKTCMRANIFQQSPATLIPFLLTLTAIGCRTKRSNLVADSLREMAGSYHLFTDPVRLIGIMLGGEAEGVALFTQNNLLKWIRKECILIDAALRGDTEIDKGRTKHKDTKDRNGRVTDGLFQYQSNKTLVVTNRNPHHLAMQGHILSNNRNFQAALVCYLRAYEFVPDSAMLCLCISIAYLGKALQRKTDNPQYCVIEAAAFMDKYRKLRLLDSTSNGVPAKQREIEVEYNLGRMFQQIQMNHYAISHYEKALSCAKEGRLKLSNGLLEETAFNLSLCYQEAGNVKQVEHLYRTYLTL